MAGADIYLVIGSISLPVWYIGAMLLFDAIVCLFCVISTTYYYIKEVAGLAMPRESPQIICAKESVDGGVRSDHI